MKTVSVKVFNQLFKDRGKYFISESKGHTGISSNDGYGVQGEYNEYFKFYRHPEMNENLFLRITYHTDSYGNDDFMESVDFVEGVEKTIKVYEPI